MEKYPTNVNCDYLCILFSGGSRVIALDSDLLLAGCHLGVLVLGLGLLGLGVGGGLGVFVGEEVGGGLSHESQLEPLEQLLLLAGGREAAVLELAFEVGHFQLENRGEFSFERK